MADGKGCRCGAYGSCECGCPDVDWTPQEVYDLRAKLEEAETKLLEMPVVIYPKGELQKKIEELESRLKEVMDELDGFKKKCTCVKKVFDHENLRLGAEKEV